jgi:hypothetical protein
MKADSPQRHAAHLSATHSFGPATHRFGSEKPSAFCLSGFFIHNYRKPARSAAAT